MSCQLKSLESFSGRPGPVLLIIMDGVGIGKKDASDGVFVARTPCLDKLVNGPLYTEIQAHGTAVGMPSDDDMGNSEVGHNALGSGRVFDQGAKLVEKSIDSGAIFKTPIWEQLTSRAKDGQHTLHFIGLLSDGNVHSNVNHLLAMLRQCATQGVSRIRIHGLMDGRDVYEKSALKYIDQTEQVLTELNQKYKVDYAIASGGGRMITTMDRYNADWDVVKRGWEAHVLGQARAFASAAEAVQTLYDEDPDVNDQFLNPFIIEKDGRPVGPIEDGDSVIFFNFRGDRAIEISKAFEAGPEFDKFDRKRCPDVLYAGMMEYDGDIHVPKKYLVNPPQIDRAASVYLCGCGIKSFAISETQKYGHVTYFWNGNKSGYVDEALETYIEIPSDKIQFQKAPKMKAHEITEKTMECLKSGQYKFGRVNFPNGDMVGHTGDEAAIVTAMETVDECVGRLIETVNELKGVTVITADHGNADEMYTIKKGEKVVSTAHSLNPVMVAIVDSQYSHEYKMADLEKKGLSNVAATLFNLLGYQKPENYDPSLIDLT